tara:strand:- start:2 stop:700 length:699 start_codon:yes stop_codon:yes gene_type:complete
MNNDKIIPKNSGNKGAYIAAVEMMASDLTLTYKDIANKLGIHKKTLGRWLQNGNFVEAVYKRYMEIAGVHIPSVVQAIIEEAKLGNVHAARLVLEHFGKLENKLKIQVESNFEKFMKGDDVEEAEFFEVTNEQEEVLDALSDHIDSDDIDLPERHISNNSPKARDDFEKNRLKYKIKEKHKDEEEAKKQAERYKIRRRAKAVDLELLAPGRKSRSERDHWMKELEKREKNKV